jgi:predicted signal transduction protein with EAL and GGDEF domain
MPIIVAGTITALVAIFLSGSHCCHLQSHIVEIPLMILTPVLSCLWIARAKTTGKAWLRCGLAFVFTIAIQITYLTWLHSDSFPRALLSRQAREEDARLHKMMEDIKHQNSVSRTPSGGNRTNE